MLCSLYKNQHMLAGSACTVLPIIISVVILTTDRELDQDTCREGVDTAETEKNASVMMWVQLCVFAVTPEWRKKKKKLRLQP